MSGQVTPLARHRRLMRERHESRSVSLLGLFLGGCVVGGVALTLLGWIVRAFS